MRGGRTSRQMRSPATRRTIRPKQCSSTCCAVPGRAGWRRCSRAPRSRCWPCAEPRRERCAHRPGCDPIDDPSNADQRFVRNRVRHEVLPLLSDVANRDVVPLLVRTADVLRADDRLLDLLAGGDRPDGRPGTRCCGSGPRSPGPAGVDQRRSLSAGRGHPRPGDGRGPRGRPGLRPRRRPTPPTASSAPGNRRHRVPSKEAGRAVTSANGMGSPWVEIGTLVASPAR